MTMMMTSSSNPSRGGGHRLFLVVLLVLGCLLGDVVTSSSTSTSTSTTSRTATTTIEVPTRTLASSSSSSFSFQRQRRRHYHPPSTTTALRYWDWRGGGGGGSSTTTDTYHHRQGRRNKDDDTLPNTANSAAITTTTTTATSTVLNLVKSIMGAAIFTIPAGMATFSDSKRAIWFPTFGLLLGIGFLSAKSFVWIGQVCGETGAKSYPQAWSHSIGPSTQWIPHFASLLTTLQAIVSYAIVLSTTLPQLLQAFGILVQLTRRQALVGLMGGVLLPLCLLRSLSALAPFSFVGLMGLLYTAIVMTIRYMDGSYTTTSSDPTAAIPTFGNRLDWWHPAVLVLAAKLGNAYMAHYQAPTMYHELLVLHDNDNDNKKNHNNNNDKKKQSFQKVVQISYFIVAALYTWMTMVGFGTFGAASTSFVLDSYSTTHDVLISASRCAIFVSLLCSFPLVFAGFRTSIRTTTMTSTLSSSAPSTTTSHTLWTVGLLSMITLLAYFVTDIGTLLSLGGGTYVCWLTFVFPPLMILKLSSSSSSSSQLLQAERPMAILTFVVGVILSMVGMQQFYQTHILK